MILAQAIPPSSSPLELTVAVTAVIGGVVAILGGLLALFSYFATRREVDKMDDRISTLEGTLPPMERRINANGELRAVKIHNRMNRLSDGLHIIAGRLGCNLPKEIPGEDDAPQID